MQPLHFCGLKKLLIITLTIVIAAAGLLLIQQPAQAQEDHTGQSCGDCHLDFQAAWSKGVHAIAYDRESFQEVWAKENNDPDCLQCHTTIYEPPTGEYLSQNIECEACHGLNPPSHPPEPFVIKTDAGICGDCHTTTFDEWRHSLHAFTDDMGAIGCAVCHNPHGQNVRFATITELCVNCHKADPDSPADYANTYVHLTHNEVEFESAPINCASCHMYNRQHDELHELADHTMSVTTRPCTDCHETLSQTGNFDILVDVDTALAQERDQLQVRVTELQTELSTVKEERETQNSAPDYVQLTQGLIIGLGVGITFIWVLARRENGNANAK